MRRIIGRYGCFIIALYYVATFFLDRLIFDFDRLNVFNYVCIKVVLLLVLLTGYYCLSKLRFLKTRFFLVYCVIFFVIFLVLYPGTWLGSDVYLIYEKAITCDFYYHLNYLTTLFYIMSFMVIPLPVAPVIFEILFSAIVFAYIVEKTTSTFKIKRSYAWLLMIPFTLFHSIFYILYPNRPILFGLIMLVIFVTLLCDYYKKTSITKFKLFLLVLMTAIAGNIRTEAIYLIVVVPVLAYFIYGLNGRGGKFGLLKYTALFLLPFLMVAAPQKSYELFGQTLYERQSRNLPTYISPLSLMLVDDTINIDNKEKEAIDKVLNIDDLKEYSSFYDVPCIWRSADCVRGFNEEEYIAFRKSFASVVLKNKRLFLDSKYKVFLASATLVEPDHFTTFEIFDDGGAILGGVRPLLSNRIRRSAYKIIEGRTGGDFVDLVYRLVNNLVLPLCAILIYLVYFAYKRRLVPLAICCVYVFGVVVVFFTAPAAYFMYYYFAFMWGWYLIVLAFIKFLSSIRRKKQYMI